MWGKASAGGRHRQFSVRIAYLPRSMKRKRYLQSGSEFELIGRNGQGNEFWFYSRMILVVHLHTTLVWSAKEIISIILLR